MAKRCKFCNRKMEKEYFEEVTLNGIIESSRYVCSCKEFNAQEQLNNKLYELDNETYNKLMDVLSEYNEERDRIIKYCNDGLNTTVKPKTKSYITQVNPPNSKRRNKSVVK